MIIGKNRKGFTLVELLAVIVVLAIVMSIAVVAITTVIDNARKSSFVMDAKQFLNGAITLVEADDLNNLLGTGGTATYAPKCVAGSGSTKYIPVADIEVRAGTGEKSPYGTNYIKGTKGSVTESQPGTDYSYIRIAATNVQGSECTYTYAIYLTDGYYTIGTQTSPTLLENITTASVKPKS